LQNSQLLRRTLLRPIRQFRWRTLLRTRRDGEEIVFYDSAIG